MALPLWIIVLLGCVREIETQSGQGPKLVMSKQKAVKECSNRGKTLVNFKDVTANPRSMEYLSQLEDGESAWIDGYAEYSPFVAWQGCFISTASSLRQPSFTMDSKTVFDCLNICNSYNSEWRYIGVENTTCHCINYNQRLELKAVNDSWCAISCDYNAVDSCGGQSYMSVYAIFTERSSTMRWADDEPSERPCMFIKKSQNSYNSYTVSCHTAESLYVSGYLCTHSAYNLVLDTTTCNKTFKYDGVNRCCLVREIVSRRGAFEGCLFRKGILADLTVIQNMQEHLLKVNQKYWISVYRTFRLFNSTGPETLCTAAINANGILYLEPDNCNRQKHYLCKDETSLHSRQIASTVSVPIESITANVTRRKADETPIAYIIPSVLIVILLVGVISFVIYWRYKTRRNQRSSDGTDDAHYKTDNLINEQTVSSVSSDPGQNGEFKCLIAKPKPDKPVRQTLKRRTQGAEYENFTLKSKETESKEKNKKKGKEKQKRVDDYDKINFKQRNNVNKEVDEEVNVYNHVVNTDNDYYDTMKSTKSSHSLGICKLDDTYSHMKDGEVVGDHCASATPDEKQCNGGETEVNLSENKNVPEKDITLETNKQSRFVIVDDDSSEGMTDGDKVKEMTHGEPITYTEIAEVSIRNEMENSEITGGTDQWLHDKLSNDSVKDECTFRLAEKQSSITFKHVQCNDMDHLKDEELIQSEVDNTEQKTDLNYMDVNLNDTAGTEHE